jgi:hypothetical protein
MAGWAVTASGNSDDPNVHHALLARLRELLSHPEAGTGSSEFNSPHAAAANFHLDGPETAGPSAPVAAGGAEQGDGTAAGTGEPQA